METENYKKGLLPRVVDELFEAISLCGEATAYKIKLSMVEIYMEIIRDLLDLSKDNIQIEEHEGHGMLLCGATEKRVSTGKLVLVDLTGSETTDADGRALEEAKTIKKSLSALENMIDALISGQENHISFRDSKHTRILQATLGGSFQTALLCCCSPGLCHFPKTLCTRLFGARNSYDVILFLSLMTDESISVLILVYLHLVIVSQIKALSDLHEILSSIKEKTEKLVHTNAELMRKNQKLKEIMRETYEKEMHAWADLRRGLAGPRPGQVFRP
ncbi:putative plus-end-directed kinesin ATPase [Helianthus anomalus]